MKTKRCSKCETRKPIGDFRSHKGHKDGRYSVCKECEREDWWALREEVFSHYGGYVCVACGETRPEKLQIDHINNDGKSHRAQKGQAARKIIKWLKSNDYPDGFQVLCGWCNLVKAITLDDESQSPEWKRKVKSLAVFLGGEDVLIDELKRIKTSSP